MAKLDGQVPNPGAGGTYLLDPETGELTLTQSTTAQKNNGTDPQEVSDCEDRIDLRD